MNTVERPNIALILFDSLSAPALQGRLATLPSLQALQAESVNFANAHACSPESSPARASLFTGLGMAAHGVWTDGVSLPKRETTVTEVFGRIGYETWLVGRRQLAGVSHWTTEHARPYEYTHFDWAHGPLHRSRQNAYLTWLQAKVPDLYAAIFPAQPNPDDTDIPAWQRQAMANLPDALSFNTWIGRQFSTRLAIRSEKPFFGIASFVVGDTGGARDMENACVEGLDDRALLQADAALGAILQKLPDDTIVVVSAGRGSDGATDVPLFMQMKNQSARTIDGIVSTMDIVPTLYDAAQVTRPQRIQGQNLLTGTPRGWAFSRLRNPNLPQETVLHTDRWKIVMMQTAGAYDLPQFQLYDRNADPLCAHDLATIPDHAETLEHLIDLLIDTRVALEDRTEPRIASF